MEELKATMNRLLKHLEFARQKGFMQSTEGASASSERTTTTSMLASRSFRIGKLDFPKFNGDNVIKWFYRCDHHIKVNVVPDKMKVDLATIHIDGDTLLGHQFYMKRKVFQGATVSWEEYSTAVNSRFGLSPFDDLIINLKTSNSRGHLVSITAPSLPFPLCPTRRPDDGTTCVKSRFGRTKAWTPSTGTYGPTTYDLWCRLLPGKASWIHARCYVRQTVHKPPHTHLPRILPSHQPPELQTPHPGVPPTRGGIKMFTSKEIEDKRAKGICFRCDEKYTPGHKCKRHHLFMMEIEDDEPPIEADSPPNIAVEEQPLVSLHAMTNSLGDSTIHLEGQVGSRRLHILIDNGNTHNFLDLNTAKKLGCAWLPQQQLKVTVVNNNNMPCKCVCVKSLCGYYKIVITLLMFCYFHCVAMIWSWMPNGYHILMMWWWTLKGFISN